MARERILVVDDEPVFLKLITAFLRRLDFDVLDALSLRSALDTLAQETVDLVLCDLQLGDGSGMTVLKEVRDHHLDLPVVMISGTAQMDDVTTALRLGATDVLLKPINELAMVEYAVESALERYRLQQENRRLTEELEAANVELQLNLRLLEESKLAGREVQQQLFPETLIRWHEITLRYQLFTASEIADQFVDYVALDDRYLAAIIGRFSHAGSNSAFLSVVVKTLFNQPLKQYRPGEPSVLLNPGAFLDYLNIELLKSQLEQPVRAFYLVIDREKHQLHYANAGYQPGPVLSGEPLQDGQAPLGMFEWSRYQEHIEPFVANTQLLMANRPLEWNWPLDPRQALSEQLALPEEGGRDDDLLLLGVFHQVWR
ncbi:response regulator [Gallaecimonas pentaromativorans]|uniref:Stage II sporulation protein E n=1 Tax=Gallaecimonas pentaromativorans TaxID=584787 RepID=A0A3N1P4G9_9GAMM|nr:response regulator [Gallaecimonas pentaromativorans]MED5526649.1 response regulator [Pseudomonadota bacterium]ROQ22548.1 stage II sporulation protein E [Gallaecimonas pentaromativorans]